jgi:hypothetical protein
VTRIAYLDCFSGISGDMLLGALIDAGVDAAALRDELAKLQVPGWSLRTERVQRAGLAATKAHVDLAESPQPHRRLPDVLALIEASTLPQDDRQRAASVFRLLAAAEARVHGVAEDQIDSRSRRARRDRRRRGRRRRTAAVGHRAAVLLGAAGRRRHGAIGARRAAGARAGDAGADRDGGRATRVERG